MSEGWICLHRGLMDWEWYGDINTRLVFIHCLLRANHKDRSWRGIMVNRGQFITSYGNLAEETGLSVKQVRTALNKLKGTGEVASKSSSQHTVITVKNYAEYQDEGKQKGKPRASEGQAEGKRGATNNNDNNDNNDNKREREPKKKRFAPPSQIEINDYFVNKESTDQEGENFYNYYESNGWMVGRNKMKCWKASARKWISNSKENNYGKSNGTAISKREQDRAEVERQLTDPVYAFNNF